MTILTFCGRLCIEGSAKIVFDIIIRTRLIVIQILISIVIIVPFFRRFLSIIGFPRSFVFLFLIINRIGLTLGTMSFLPVLLSGNLLWALVQRLILASKVASASANEMAFCAWQGTGLVGLSRCVISGVLFVAI